MIFRIFLLFFFSLFFCANGFTQTFDFKFNQLAPWMSWMDHKTTKLGMSFTLPGTADVNHIDGIGTIFLVAHLPMHQNVAGSPGNQDLRNAEIELTIKGTDVNLHGGRLVWWVVAGIPESERDPHFTYQQSNWAFIGKTLNTKSLSNNKWTTVSYRLDPSPINWTYAGTNTSIKGSWGNRYARYPIGKLLTNVDETLHFVIIGAKKPPQGTIELSHIQIKTAAAPHLPDYDQTVSLMTNNKFAEAAPQLKILADNGNTGAAFYYANILNYGTVGKVDICAARAYYEEAEKDMVEASVELAYQDIHAMCNPRNYHSALKRLDRAASIPRARYYRAMIRLHSFPDKADMNAIIDDLKYAANAGNMDAMRELGMLYMDKGSKAEALNWFAMAENNKETDPQKNVFYAASIKTLKKG